MSWKTSTGLDRESSYNLESWGTSSFVPHLQQSFRSLSFSKSPPSIVLFGFQIDDYQISLSTNKNAALIKKTFLIAKVAKYGTFIASLYTSDARDSTRPVSDSFKIWTTQKRADTFVIKLTEPLSVILKSTESVKSSHSALI